MMEGSDLSYGHTSEPNASPRQLPAMINAWLFVGWSLQDRPHPIY